MDGGSTVLRVVRMDISGLPGLPSADLGSMKSRPRGSSPAAR
jgi:hypothetical protein